MLFNDYEPGLNGIERRNTSCTLLNVGLPCEKHPRDVPWLARLDDVMSKLALTSGGMTGIDYKAESLDSNWIVAVLKKSKPTLTNWARKGKIVKRVDADGRWAMPRHHLARYLAEVWANEWPEFDVEADMNEPKVSSALVGERDQVASASVVKGAPTLEVSGLDGGSVIAAGVAPPSGFLALEAAARFLGWEPQNVWAYVESGDLKAHPRNGGWVVRRSLYDLVGKLGGKVITMYGGWLLPPTPEDCLELSAYGALPPSVLAPEGGGWVDVVAVYEGMAWDCSDVAPSWKPWHGDVELEFTHEVAVFPGAELYPRF